MKKKLKKPGKVKSAYNKSKSFFVNDLLRKTDVTHSQHPLGCNDVDITTYCYYQTTQAIKMYVTLPGVELLPKSRIRTIFKERSFELSIFNLNDKNHHLSFDNLTYCLLPKKCKHAIRKDKIVLELVKKSPRFWRFLTEIVNKEEWMQAYCEMLEDIPEFTDADILYNFAEDMWGEVCKIQEKEFNYMKPPSRMHDMIPSLRKHPSFKTIDDATNFYKNELKRDCFNEGLYVVLGGCLLEKQRIEKQTKLACKATENIDESPLNCPSTPTFNEPLNNVIIKCTESSISKEKDAAESKKLEGNDYYKSGKFYAALQAYLEAIELWPNCASFYSNSSASYMMLGMYNEALKMAQKSVKIDPSFSKGFIRIGKCNIALGNTKAALKSLNQAKELEHDCDEIEREISRVALLLKHLKEGRTAADKKKYISAAAHFDSACSIACASSSILLQKVEYLIFCDKFAEASEIAKKLLYEKLDDADAHCVFGMCAYYQDDKEKAFKEFDKALKISKNHVKTKNLYKLAKDLYAKKERGNEAFLGHRYTEALDCYLQGIQIDFKNKVMNAKLYFNIALVKLKQNKYDEAIESLTSAIVINKVYVKAFLKRASCYQEINKHNEAVRDLKEVIKLDPSDTYKKLLTEAEIKLKRMGQEDYYEILGLTPFANLEDIKNAYKKMALLHHPDKHQNSKDKDFHEVVFKNISEAYNVLKDPKKRAKYDEGDSFFDDDEYEVPEQDLFKLFLWRKFFETQRNFSALFDDSSDDSDDDFEDSDDQYDFEDDEMYYTTDSEFEENNYF